MPVDKYEINNFLRYMHAPLTPLEVADRITDRYDVDASALEVARVIEGLPPRHTDLDIGEAVVINFDVEHK